MHHLRIRLTNRIIDKYFGFVAKHPYFKRYALRAALFTVRIATPATLRGGSYAAFELTASFNVTIHAGFGLLVFMLFWPDGLVLPDYNTWADEQGYGLEYARFTA
jgi:hypothetical protein